MLRAENLGIGYPGRTLADGLSLEFGAGQVWAILGRNGSGKSTLLQTLAGLRDPQQGSLTLGGTGLRLIRRRTLATQLGVLLQDEPAVFWGSTLEYVLLGRHPHSASPFGWSADDQAIAVAEIEARNLGPFTSRAYATLSGGERQRARAAALFAQRPRAYLLDEPLQHLDLPHQVALLDRLAREARVNGALVVMVLHDLYFAARYCDNFLLLYGDGRTQHGRGPEVLRADTLGSLYGFPLEVFEVKGERLFFPGRPADREAHV